MHAKQQSLSASVDLVFRPKRNSLKTVNPKGESLRQYRAALCKVVYRLGTLSVSQREPPIGEVSHTASALTRGAYACNMGGMGIIQRQRKHCQRCSKPFHPTGANCKRCPKCRREYELEARRERWHRTYVKKGYNQKGPNNNAWKGGRSPQYYQKVAALLPPTCARCGTSAVLVHHKDENRSNSDLSNLERMCKRCHQLIHECARNLPKKVVFKSKPCIECGHLFVPTGPRSTKCTQHMKV